MNALMMCRIENPPVQMRQHLASALWSITSIAEVAGYVIQNYRFLENIIETIKSGPDCDSESHTGILANCLSQRSVDPGLLKPVIQTLLQLLKSTKPMTVKHCLRIVAAIAHTERGSSILLEMKTDLYLRTLMHQDSNVPIKKCAQSMITKLNTMTRSTNTGFMWSQAQTVTQRNAQQSTRDANDFARKSRFTNRGFAKTEHFSQDDEKPIDFTLSQTSEYVDLGKSGNSQSQSNQSSQGTWDNRPEDHEEKPNNYSVEDTPGITPREQSPNIHKMPIPKNIMEEGTLPKSGGPSGVQSGVQSGYNSGMQSGARTPAGYQATPLIYSRQSTPESLEDRQSLDLDALSESEHGSVQMSGQISPSDIPDSPSQAVQPRLQSEITAKVESGKRLFENTNKTNETPKETTPVTTSFNSSGLYPKPLFSNPPSQNTQGKFTNFLSLSYQKSL